MQKIYTIYGYYQPAENKWYVGRTSRTQKQRAGKNGIHYQDSPYFYYAIHQYGWNTFEYHILEQTTDEELSWELEQKWVNLKGSVFPYGYNKTYGGEGVLGLHHTEESILKMKKSLKGNRKGVPKSAEQKRKMKNIMTNRKDMSKKTQQFTRDGLFIKEYPSAAEASRQTGIRKEEISACCLGIRNRKSAGGYVWRYV